MSLLCSLLLLADGTATGRDNRSLPVAQHTVFILKPNPPTDQNPFRGVVSGTAATQVIGAQPNVVFRSSVPVVSIERGLPVVQRASKSRVLAAIEVDGYFFYATVLVGPPREPPMFIQGYAIRRDGKDVLSFSVW
jgi:hypothetical protein